jgi:hypothetical protein
MMALMIMEKKLIRNNRKGLRTNVVSVASEDMRQQRASIACKILATSQLARLAFTPVEAGVVPPVAALPPPVQAYDDDSEPQVEEIDALYGMPIQDPTSDDEDVGETPDGPWVRGLL